MDAIVREVLRRLGAGGQPAASRAAGLEKRPHTRSPEADNAQLTVNEPVVTLALLDGRLSGVRCLVLRPDAVVTPAVRDELRSRNIALSRNGAADAAGDSGADLVVAAAATGYDPNALIRAAAAAVQQVERLADAELAPAVEQLSRAVTGDRRLGLLLTDQPAAALCLANRAGGVRAAWGLDLDSVCQAVQSIGANLLVVQPAGQSLYALSGLVRQFVRNGCRPCPPAYRHSLDSQSASQYSASQHSASQRQR